MPEMMNGRKGCATCEHWGGSRNIVNRTIVLYESDSSTGGCYKIKTATRPTRAVDYCTHYEKWSRI